jgi:hypothetical protein
MDDRQDELERGHNKSLIALVETRELAYLRMILYSCHWIFTTLYCRNVYLHNTTELPHNDNLEQAPSRIRHDIFRSNLCNSYQLSLDLFRIIDMNTRAHYAIPSTFVGISREKMHKDVVALY